MATGNHTIVVVTLTIKGPPEMALIAARRRLNELLRDWFLEDMRESTKEAGFQEGSLLLYNFRLKP